MSTRRRLSWSLALLSELCCVFQIVFEMQPSNQCTIHPKYKHKNNYRPPGLADGGASQGLLPANRTSLSKRLWKVNNVE
jgi:hypothetical protein